MGSRNKLSVPKVAPIIARLVEKIEDVDVSSRAPESLSVKIAKELKFAHGVPFHQKLVYLWQKGGLYSAVEELLLKKDGSIPARYTPRDAGKTHTANCQNVGVMAHREAKSFVPEPIIQVEKKKFKVINVAGDGNCLFRCFSRYLFGDEQSYYVARKAVVEYVKTNWTDEVALLNSTCEEKPFKNESHYGTVMGSDTTYGTDFEISIFARLYKVNVTIYREQYQNREIVKVFDLPCDEKDEREPLNIMFTGAQRSGHWVVLEAINDFADVCENETVKVAEVHEDLLAATNDFTEINEIETVEERVVCEDSPKIATLELGDRSSKEAATPPSIQDAKNNATAFTKEASLEEQDIKSHVHCIENSSRQTRRVCYEKSNVSSVNDDNDVFRFSTSSTEVFDSDSTDTSSAHSDGHLRKRSKNVPKTDTEYELCVDDDCLSSLDGKTKKRTNYKKENKSSRTKNGKKINRRYKKVIGEVSVASTEFKTENGHLHADRIRIALFKVMKDVMKSTCTLSFRHIRENARDLVVYAKCKRGDCEQPFQFRIFYTEKPIAEVIVASDRKITLVHKRNEWAEVYQPLSGASRVEALMKMQNRRAIDFLDDLQISTNAAVMEDGHNQKLCKLNTLYKIKSEDRCKDRLSLKSDDISDLMELQVEHSRMKDPFLRRAGLPVHAYMYTVEDLFVLKEEKDKKNKLVGHFDATGSIVRKPQHIECKRILNYDLVVKGEKEILYAAQLITAEHGVQSIGAFLREWRFFVERQLKKWPLLDAIVVDWSWALIKSVLEAWNDMTVTEYLEVSFECCRKGEDLLKNKTILKICYAHFMKIVSKTIHDKYPEYKDLKQLLLECMALLCLSRSLNELTIVFKHMVTLLLSKQSANDSLVVISNLVNKNACQTKNITDYGCQEVDADIDSVNNPNDETVYRKSPFYKRFDQIMTLKQTEIEGLEKRNVMNGVAITPNKYYAPKFMEHVVRLWMPYAVFWTALDLNQLDPNISRLSNAYSEASNKVIKEVVFEGHTRLSIADCVRKLNVRRQRTIAIINLNSNVKGTKTSRAKPKYPQTVDDPLVEEIWQKPSGKRTRDGYAHGTTLRKLRSKIEVRGQNKKQETENVQQQEAYVEERIENVETEVENFITEVVSTELVVSEVEKAVTSDKESDGLEMFYNGLVKNLDYWKKSKSNLLTVCRYETTKSLTVQSFELTACQFASLPPPQWIDGVVIDAFIASNIDDWDNVTFVPTDDTSIILGNYSERRTKTRAICKLRKDCINGKLLLPYTFLGHWRLLIADIEQERLTLLDPYETSTDKDRAFREFKSFLGSCDKITLFGSLKNIMWKEVDECEERPYQSFNDGSNCGAFIMYYAECVGNRKPFDKNFDPVAYRFEIAYNLLLKSKDMGEVCLHCCAAVKTETATCKICQRISHKDCVLKSDLKTDDEEEFVKISRKRKAKATEHVSEYFICRLCRYNTKGVHYNSSV